MLAKDILGNCQSEKMIKLYATVYEIMRPGPGRYQISVIKYGIYFHVILENIALLRYPILKCALP